MDEFYAGLKCGRLTLKLARTTEEKESIFRLRFSIFNEELGEGLAKNTQSQMDVDEFDELCDHLVVYSEGQAVGTYRILYGPKRPPQGFYSETEFYLKELGIDFNLAVELGRGCIHKDHRKQSTLMALFWGLHRYIQARNARYLIGCGSLISRTADNAEATFAELVKRNKVDFPESTHPHEKNKFQGVAEKGTAQVPPLIALYLEFGARILGRPAYDPHFDCYDLLMFMDTEQLSTWGLDLLSRFDKRLEQNYE